MNKLNRVAKVIISIVALSLICCLPIVLACDHENTEIVTITHATCTTNGLDHVVCVDCDEILESQEISFLGHSFGEYVLTRAPFLEINGVEIRTCETCGFEEYREVVCSHENVLSEIVKEPLCIEIGYEKVICCTCGTPWYNEIEKTTHLESHSIIVEEPSCYKEGLEHIVCSLCAEVLEVRPVPVIDCSFGDWKISKYSTPFERGERYKVCGYCKQKQVESYSMTMPSANSIYAPGTGICHSFYVGDMTQGNIDSHDLVYDNGYFGVSGPWILGHNYGTLSMLPNVEVGQNIYISVNGNIRTYVVRYSEFAMQNETWTDIVGQSSGLSVLSNLYGETLHMYTCYGKTKNHRWMVLAELVS